VTRIVILGGPRTGKTTLARQMIEGGAGDGMGVSLHADDLIDLGWSEATQRIADSWFNEPGPWIIEGVALSRALRKWREAHPGEAPPVDRVIRLTTPHVELTKGQAAMAKGEETVWQEIAGWLLGEGVAINDEGVDSVMV